MIIQFWEDGFNIVQSYFKTGKINNQTQKWQYFR